MYDRKTWIVLAICGLLIALNIHFSSKYRPLPAPKPAATETTSASETAPSAGLSVEPPPPPTEEELIVLKNDKVEFTLTNIGGGIK